MKTSAPTLYNGTWKDGQFGVEAVPFDFETGKAFAETFLLYPGETLHVDYPRRCGEVCTGIVGLYGVKGGAFRRLPISVGTPAVLPEIPAEVWNHA